LVDNGYFAPMKRIGLISDTHGFLDENVFRHFEDCDEIWHGGDFGNIALADQLAAFKPLKGVYGNIDGRDIRDHFPLEAVFYCEKVKVLMRHIGGAPPRYNPETRQSLDEHKPLLFISGHSHILKVIYDQDRSFLHINPGAAGKQGWHKVRTLVKLIIDGLDMRDCQIVELGRRG
jgi:putative phosphoesterase